MLSKQAASSGRSASSTRPSSWWSETFVSVLRSSSDSPTIVKRRLISCQPTTCRSIKTLPISYVNRDLVTTKVDSLCLKYMSIASWILCKKGSHYYIQSMGRSSRTKRHVSTFSSSNKLKLRAYLLFLPLRPLY